MKRVLVVHPFLFALFPVLFLYAQNIEHLSFSQIWTSVLVLLGFALIALLLFALILRSAARAGLLVSLFILLFFSYGFVHRALWAGRTEIPVSGSQILLFVWVVVFVGGSALLMRIRRGLDDVTKILNVTALILVVFSLVNIFLYEFRTRRTLHGKDNVAGIQLVQPSTLPVDALPNIYYIVLDGYARADILEELYDYDNAEFLEFLDNKGFYVADKSQSNYVQTALSLASSLSLGYLDDLASRVRSGFDDRQPLQRIIRGNTVFQFLKQLGYLTVAFPTGYAPTTLDNADIYMSSGVSWNSLEVLLLRNTPIPWLMVRQSQLNPYAPHMHNIVYAFEHLADTAQLPSPHIVFAHVVAPHPPFVFDDQGNEIPQNREYNILDGNHFFELGGTSEQYVEGYTSQLRFVNDEIMAAVDKLLSSQSSRPTIIILQADHGPGLLLDWEQPENTCFKERLSILNAVLLPGGDSAGFYAEMTPVNTFRLIFNRYFGTELELLEDESYFSTWERPYEFLDVTDAVRSGEPAGSSE